MGNRSLDRNKEKLSAGNQGSHSFLQSRPFSHDTPPPTPHGPSPNFSFSNINVVQPQVDTAPLQSLEVPAAHHPLEPMVGHIPALSRRSLPNTLQRVIEAKNKDFEENDDIFLSWQEKLHGYRTFESYEISTYVEQIKKGTINESFEEIQIKLEANYFPESEINQLINDLKAVSGTEEQGRYKYYSHADPNIEIDEKTAVITAMVTGQSYGHTRIYVEYLDGKTPKTIFTDLTVSGKGGKDEKVIITIQNLQGDDNLKKYMSNSRKKVWTISQGQAVKAVKKAYTVQDEAQKDKYKYSTHGGRDVTNLFSSKKLVNCARYGVKILKAAGVSEATAGKVVRLPATLVGEEKAKPDEKKEKE